MNKWRTKLVRIEEREFDYDLHVFAVYRNSDNAYLGDISPSNFEDMKEIQINLFQGVCPITNGWEDGMGNTCNINGWG